MTSNGHKHQKHAKLKKPKFGEFGRNELAILGSKCGVIQDLVKRLTPGLSDLNIAYVDADHKAMDSEVNEDFLEDGAAVYMSDKIRFKSVSSSQLSNKFLQKQHYNSAGLILLNGNHFAGASQVVIADEVKRDSLERKKDRLTNVVLVLLPEDVETIPDWLAALLKESADVPVLPLSDSSSVSQRIRDWYTKNLPMLKGLVLAGGKSERMGRDKSKLEYYGIPQRVHLANLLSKQVDQVYISGRADQEEELQGSCPVLADKFIGLGPYGAILTAFMTDPDAAWLVIACDLPSLPNQPLTTSLPIETVRKWLPPFLTRKRTFRIHFLPSGNPAHILHCFSFCRRDIRVRARHLLTPTLRSSMLRVKRF